RGGHVALARASARPRRGDLALCLGERRGRIAAEALPDAEHADDSVEHAHLRRTRLALFPHLCQCDETSSAAVPRGSLTPRIRPLGLEREGHLVGGVGARRAYGLP